jgi:hypothetical protein
MTPQEIHKKACEAFPKLNRCDFADDDAFGSAVLVQTIKRDAYAKAPEEISALPTIKGWVARNKNGTLWFFLVVPQRGLISWVPLTANWFELDESFFPDLRWEDDAKKVELPIIRK